METLGSLVGIDAPFGLKRFAVFNGILSKTIHSARLVLFAANRAKEPAYVDRRYRCLCTGPATPPTQLDGEPVICLGLFMRLTKYIPAGECSNDTNKFTLSSPIGLLTTFPGQAFDLSRQTLQHSMRMRLCCAGVCRLTYTNRR